MKVSDAFYVSIPSAKETWKAHQLMNKAKVKARRCGSKGQKDPTDDSSSEDEDIQVPYDNRPGEYNPNIQSSFKN